MSLGKAEIDEMIKEDGHAETVCHFCGDKFYFNKDELEILKEKAKR
jgi:molecular chaperone Hsp33